MPPHSLTSPQVGNFGRWSCENVRRKSQMFEWEVAQKSDEICAKTSMSDGWPHQNGILESLRHLQHSCLLGYPYICMWFVISTARDSCHVVFFHVTLLILSSSSGRGSLLIWLRLFQNHVTFLICSGGESRSIQPFELDCFLGKRVRSYCRLPRRTRLCVCQKHVTCGIKKRYSSWIRFCASKRYMERALLETPLFSLANRPGDLCTETKCLF